MRITENISMDFIDKLVELSGENVKVCMQCGTCSGSCPMTEHMDHYPRKLIHFAQFGLLEMLQNINTYWQCASCYTCSVRCPRGIDIAKVMEAMRQLALRTNENHIEPSQIPAEMIKGLPQIAMVAGFRKLTS
ncbi:MAG: heterodisulfide reductase [Proteobacteria bacterium]|nr:heterodisulfide reductase [Pseudomonadota bacterium]